MEYTRLGNSDLTVSRLCLGCMGLGDASNGQHSWTVDSAKSEEIVAAAIECGVNFFDTAAVYQSGTSERYLGSALAKLAPRDKVVIATKFMPNGQGSKHIMQSLNNSLDRLNVEYVDLYICHKWDYTTPIEETMETLNAAVESGKARYIGISNCFAYQLQKANDFAAAHGYAQFVSVQNHYNLLFREEEREMFECCAELGVAMTPYSPLAAGRLVKAAGETSKRLTEDSYARGKYDRTAEQDSIIVARVGEIADKRGLSRVQVAIAWLLSKVAAPVVGATKPSHITQAASGVGITLTRDELAYLETPYIPHRLVGVMSENKPN